MFFRNLTLFRFPETFGGFFKTPLQDELSEIEAHLRECQLKPAGPLEMSSRGFVAPLGRDSDAMSHKLGDCTWVTVGSEEKILPPAVVNELLARKLEEIEEQEGRKPGGRTRKRLREDLLHDLLPKAFVKPGRCDAYLDFTHNFIAVDTSSRRTGEQVVSEIRRAVGTFPALPLNVEKSARAVLTAWLAGEAMPEGLVLGEECELRDAVDGGAIVRCQNSQLRSEEIDKHLQAGMQCVRLAVVLNDHISFVIGEDLTIRKLRFRDGAVDNLESAEREDHRAELDARFALMTGELSRLFELLDSAFSISSCDPDGAAPKPRKRKTSASSGATVTISVSATDTQPGWSRTIAAEDLAKLGESLEQYEHAVSIVRSTGKAGISHLQRQLGIGYNRAARLIEAMESQGVVSPPSNAGERTVLAPKSPAQPLPSGA
jgi:recombination associated protein RdgC